MWLDETDLPTDWDLLIRQKQGESCLTFIFILQFFQLLTHKIFTCHTISESWHSYSRRTQQISKNQTLIIGLWLSFQFHKTLFAKHNTHRSNRNEYYGKDVCKCLLLRCVCDILNAGLHFARYVRTLHFVCAILGFVCKVLNKRGKVLKMCLSSWKNL